MGATSVTGVSGPGSAAEQGAGNKGSEHMSLAVHHLIGPRVVMCGHATLNEDGTGTVYYPELVEDANFGGVTEQYCVFLSSNEDTFPYWGSFTTTSFGVTASPGAEVCWQIVKCGLWGSPTTNLQDT
jgi:hypothetical protein